MAHDFKDTVVTAVSLAMYVAPRTGKSRHTDRPYHGFVLNDEEAVREYRFSDGRVMRVEGGDFLYLPKGSTYTVKSLSDGGCYAINFDADFTEEPFFLHFRSRDAVLKLFRTAEEEWRRQSAYRQIAVMQVLYALILQLHAERERAYVAGEQLKRIEPALKRMRESFTENELSVSELAELCHVSEAYFRRIFHHKFGVSPKEYMIGLRIGYAKELLASGQFSVTETATMCGYFEPSHFSREFTKRVGVSPNAYKKGCTP